MTADTVQKHAPISPDRRMVCKFTCLVLLASMQMLSFRLQRSQLLYYGKSLVPSSTYNIIPFCRSILIVVSSEGHINPSHVLNESSGVSLVFFHQSPLNGADGPTRLNCIICIVYIILANARCWRTVTCNGSVASGQHNYILCVVHIIPRNSRFDRTNNGC